MATQATSGGGIGPINISIDMETPEPGGPDRIEVPTKNEDSGVTKDQGSMMVDLMKKLLRQAKNDPNAKAMNEQLDMLGTTEKRSLQFTKEGQERTPRGKDNKKVRDYMVKRMVAADLLTKMTGYLKKIASSGFELLKALMLLALLGPEFLDGIITFVLDTLMMVIEAFIRAIPTVINAIVKFLPKIIALIAELVPKVLDTLISAFSNLSQNELLPKPLRVFFGLLGDIVKVIKFLTENMWILLVAAGLWLVVQAAMVAARIAETVAAAPMVFAIMAIVIAALLLVAVFILVWKYGDLIYEKFMGLSTGMKILIGVLALIFFPITVLITMIILLVNWVKDLIAVFTWFSRTKLWKIIRDGIAKMINDVINSHKQMFAFVSGIADSIKNALSPDKIKSAVKEAFDGIFGSGSFDTAMNMMMRAKKWIDDMLEAILENDAIKAIIATGKAAARLLGDTEGNRAREAIRRQGAITGEQSSQKIIDLARMTDPEERLQAIDNYKDELMKITYSDPAKKLEVEQTLLALRDMAARNEDGNAILKKIADRIGDKTNFSFREARQNKVFER